MEIIELTKQLIAIPSYVDGDVNENTIAEFIYQYLSKNTGLNVVKNEVEQNRFNIIAYTKDCEIENRFDVDLLLIDHIDTVQPKNGWMFDQFTAQEKEGIICGLGANDTKANVAVLMKTAEKITTGRIMFLFYIDEEYDFKGVKKFIKNYSDKLSVKKIISADGENMNIRAACRGLIELDIECFGKSGHAANPSNGVNAIIGFYRVMNSLSKYLSKQNDFVLGKPTLNIAYVRSGLYKDKRDGTVILGRNGNNIPDYLESTIELRTNTGITMEKLSKKMSELFKAQGLQYTITKIRHDLPPWKTDKKELRFLTTILKKKNQKILYTDASKSGYVDLAMLADAFKCPSCCIGVIGGNSHNVNEWSSISSITSLECIMNELVLCIK